MSLNLDQILKAKDSAIQCVPCPEWGGDVYVRTISSNERDKFELSIAEDKVGARAALVGAALCDESGKPLNPTSAEVKGLGQKSSGVVDRIFEAVITLNKMRREDVEKIEGNSGATAEHD